jgi:uncharacterized protein YjbI with pentapeptide repeats
MKTNKFSKPEIEKMIAAARKRGEVPEIHYGEFFGTTLKGLDLSRCKFEHTCFSKCDLSDTNFEGSVFIRCDFSKALANNSNFDYADFHECDFKGAILSGSDFSRTLITASWFLNAILGRTNFDNANIKGACFDGVSATKATFRYAILRRCSFRHVVIDNAVFHGTIFQGVDITGTQIHRADLKNTVNLDKPKERKMKYKIVQLGVFYLPDLQGDRTPRILPDLYNTVADARMVVEALDMAIYHLQHNEAGRPDYLILREVDADFIESGRNGDGGNYDWGGAECDCGECSTCTKMMIDQDRWYCRHHQIQ